MLQKCHYEIQNRGAHESRNQGASFEGHGLSSAVSLLSYIDIKLSNFTLKKKSEVTQLHVDVAQQRNSARSSHAPQKKHLDFYFHAHLKFGYKNYKKKKQHFL